MFISFALNSCDGSDTKQRAFIGRLLVALKRPGASEKSRFYFSRCSSDILSLSCMHVT